VARRLEPLGQSSTLEEPVFGPSYRVVPGHQIGQIPTMFVNMQSEATPSLSWEHITGPFLESEIELTLINFFDWNILNWRDFRYFKVKIRALEKRSALVGKEGLVDVLDADVLWNVPG
jgi:hypothetical protein